MQIVSFNSRAKSTQLNIIPLRMSMCAIARFLAELINLADIPWKEILVTRFSAGR